MKKIIGYIICTPFYIYFEAYKIFFYSVLKFLRYTKGLKYILIRFIPTKGHILIDINDTGITGELLTINLKEPINTETIIQNILSSKEINTIIDLGANIGDFVLIENHYSKAKIFAFEPVEKNFNILKANLYLNNLEELVYFEKTAIGDTDGKTKIFTPQAGNWSSIIKSSFTKDAPSETVSIKKLFTIFSEQKLDTNGVFIRTDIEGYEYNLLKGNIDFFKSLTNSWFCIEFHDQILDVKQCVEFMDIMERLGYTVPLMTNETPLWLGFYRSTILYPILLKSYKWKVSSNLIGLSRENVSFNTIRQELKDKKYPYGPHINFYKN